MCTDCEHAFLCMLAYVCAQAHTWEQLCVVQTWRGGGQESKGEDVCWPRLTALLYLSLTLAPVGSCLCLSQTRPGFGSFSPPPSPQNREFQEDKPWSPRGHAMTAWAQAHGPTPIKAGQSVWALPHLSPVGCKRRRGGPGSSSVAECFPGMREALSSIPSTIKKERKAEFTPPYHRGACSSCVEESLCPWGHQRRSSVPVGSSQVWGKPSCTLREAMYPLLQVEPNRKGKRILRGAGGDNPQPPQGLSLSGPPSTGRVIT